MDSDLNIGGCSSGCCLASPRRRCDDDVANLEDVEEEQEEVSVEKVHEENSVEDGGLQNPAKTDDLDGIGKSGDLEVKSCGLNRLDEEEEEEGKRENDLIATKTVPLIVQKDEVEKASSMATAEEIPLKRSFEADEEENASLGQKEEKSNEVKTSKDVSSTP